MSLAGWRGAAIPQWEGRMDRSFDGGYEAALQTVSVIKRVTT